MTAEALLAPVDRLRALTYRAAAPWLAPLYGDRARRVAWLGAFSIGVTFALTCAAPLWLLALGPVLLGVPHLLSDVRYLVVRPGLHLRGPLAWLAAPPLLATGFGAPPWVGLLAVAPLALAADGPRGRRLVALAVGGALVGLAVAFERPVVFALLHAHNLVALGLWWSLRPRDARAWAVPAAALFGTALLLLGAAEPVLAVTGGWAAPGSGASFEELVAATAAFAEPRWAVRVGLTFAFLQAVHYGVWLRLVPDDARRRPAPRPFAASWRALEADLGRPALWLFVALAVGVAAWGLVDLAAARWGYLRLAAFHGYLELAAAAFFFVERRRPAC